METGHATIYDVAKQAGVSVATVSRFINNPSVVSEKTQRIIKKAIHELDYVPNAFAQALKTSCSMLIMMLVPDISNEYYSKMYKVIQNNVHQYGYSIMLVDTKNTLEYELQALEVAKEHRCDAVMVFSVYESAEVRNRIEALNIPFIYNDDTNTSRECDNLIYLTASHLIEYGHKEIIYVGGAPQTYINIMRRNGFIKAMTEHGLPYNENDWFEMDFSMDAGYKAGKYISAMAHRPTAVCAANDQLAFGIILALNECGIRIPEEISITGMDDVSFARLVSPKLTTIKNDCQTRAERLSNSILSELHAREESQEALPPSSQSKVIIRESTRRLSL